MTTAVGAYATLAAVKARLDIGGADTTDDDLITDLCDQVNGYIEAETGRVMAPIASATYTYDGNGRERLYLPTNPALSVRVGGLRAITLLELARHTGAAFETVTAGTYFLRQASMPGAPFDWLWLSDVGSWAAFPKGFGTVRITATAGWAAIPDEITDIALSLAVRAYHARPTGASDTTEGEDPDMLNRAIGRFVSGRQTRLLRRYTLVGNLA